jgi:adenylate cyclase
MSACLRVQNPSMAPSPTPIVIDRTRPAFSAAVPAGEDDGYAGRPPAWGSPEAEAALAQWLVEFALASDDEAKLLEGFADRLDGSCVRVFRVSTGAEALHPTFDARGVCWRRGLGIEREEILHDRQEVDDEEWLKSPFRELADSDAETMRRRVGDSYVVGEFGLLDRLVQQQGMTDYIALAVGYGAGSTLGSIPGILISYQTDQPGGFSDSDVRLLRRMTAPFALAYKSIASVHTGRSLLATYLGSDPAKRVLNGAVVRGRAEPVEAVIWYSDLQGFTKIADFAPQEQLLPLLNAYADCIVSTLSQQRAEVLKFMGDGILAMFPIEDGVYARALDAADEVLEKVAALGREREAIGLPWTSIHLALHVGEVLYGNVGSRERLDFTVVGSAVNETARIEAMCRSLDQDLLVSSAFARALGPTDVRLVSVGRYALRGVRRPEELFTIDVDARRRR